MNRLASLPATRLQSRSFHFRHRAHAAITPRAANFSQWYQDIISSADLAETSPVKVEPQS
jgi:hypothetical protein